MPPNIYCGECTGWTYLFQRVADEEQRPVVYDPEPANESPGNMFHNVDLTETLKVLRRAGCRILDQRFPRRAYVVVGYPAP
jgi:hypothetical protein